MLFHIIRFFMPVIANFLMIFELFLFGKSVLSFCIFFFAKSYLSRLYYSEIIDITNFILFV